MVESEFVISHSFMHLPDSTSPTRESFTLEKYLKMRKQFQDILSTIQQIGINELNLEILINFFGAELIVKWHLTKKDIQQM